MEINSGYSYNEDFITSLAEYTASDIIARYDKELNIDVERFFIGVDRVQLQECDNTGYQFYLPNNTDGDSDFYEELQKFEWYYMPWKWEHDYFKKLIPENQKILEVGSGSLGFIEKMKRDGYAIDGLELNESSIIKAKSLDLNVKAEMIQDYASHNQGSYDVVCSFQVLEHIFDVESFLRAKIDCLKVGGKLIICVPNNDSFIKYSEGGILNFPPHHMGRWNSKSLSSLEKVFDIRLLKIINEPLQDYHQDWYVKTMYNLYSEKYKLVRGLNKIFSVKKIIEVYTKYNSNRIKGHSIMAIYEKK